MLYEILKTAKLGTAAAPDMFTGLLAQKMKFAKGSGEIAELLGVPPLSFKANGKPLLDWHIRGNTMQDGTPTLTNPVSVQGVGELETSGEHSGEYKIPISSGGVTTNIYLGSTQTVRQIKKLVLTGEENFGRQNISNTDPSFARFSKIFQFGSVTSTSTILYASTHFTGLKSFGTTSSTVKNCFEMRFASGTTTMMIVTNVATTATSFNRWLSDQYANGTPVTVWYVLEIPKTAAVNEPLMKIGEYADSISMTDTGIEIPTVRGNNVLTVDTTVQPSEVYIKYKK